MEHKHKLVLIITLPSLSALALIFLAFFCFRRRKAENGCRDVEINLELKEGNVEIREDLVKFEGGEGLSVVEILDAPGEVIGKSCYGTLYRAVLVNSNSLTLLRFLRPTCTLGVKEVIPIVELLGNLRHRNLVPLTAFYAGPKGEKLMVHPFYGRGNLAQFIRGEKLFSFNSCF